MDILPAFIEADGDKIVAERVLLYETLTGRTLQPAQVERLIIQAGAYRELLLRQAINSALQQNFVATASAPVLDYLGELVGVVRLPPAYAETTIRFALIATPNGLVIPAGTRVQSKDAKATFATKENVSVLPGVLSVDVVAVVDQPGEVGNGYVAGAVTEILDPQAFVVSAANIDTTSGGAETESDEALRLRIKLAPASFSNAGSRGSYAFFAKSANPLVADVAITTPTPGTVQLFPLVVGGEETPQSVINDVYAACNDEKIRPLTDTVIVTSPARIAYNLVINVTIYQDADAAVVFAAIGASVDEFVKDRARLLGRDVKRSQLLARCMVPGVYDADPVGFADIIVQPTEFAVCESIIINTIGTNVG